MFSIITPVYNSWSDMENYFERLENQTFKDFEVVIVDDLSIDDTYENIKQYQKNSELKITLLKHKNNKGPGMARNTGLEEAKRKYIVFIDSDDYVAEIFFEELETVIVKKECDCVIFDYKRLINNEKKNINTIPKMTEGFINNKDAMALSTGNVWGKVYKNEIIKEHQIKFPNLMRFEDSVFNKLYLSKISKIYYHKENLYTYVDNEDSIVNNPTLQKVLFPQQAYELLKKHIGDNFMKELEYMYIQEVIYNSIMIIISNKNFDKEEVKSIKKMLFDNVPNWRENKYLKYMPKHQYITLIFLNYNFLPGLKILSYLKTKKIRYKK